jgi:hypothetical protein
MVQARAEMAKALVEARLAMTKAVEEPTALVIANLASSRASAFPAVA